MVRLLGLLPRRALSRLTGRLVHARRPAFLARALRDLLVRRLGLDMSEAELPLSSYPSFGDCFTRRLKPGSRPLADAFLASPCDGVLSESGPIEDGRLLQCKGSPYPLAELVRDPSLAGRFLGGAYLTIYLSPRDYHRVHCPADGELVASMRVAGDLWPVNRAATAAIPRLYCLNDRSFGLFRTPLGDLALIMVGALNVGDTVLEHLPSSAPPGRLLAHEPARPVAKGDPFGTFRMGSTVILLLSPALRGALAWQLPAGPSLRCGQALLREKA